METDELKRPRGFVPIGVFFMLGTTMAAHAAATLLKPGTALDALWVLNKTGHAQLAALGPVAGLGFVTLSALMGAASVGWFRRHYWGWLLGTTNCHQRHGRSHQWRDGRWAKRSRRSADRRAAAVLYNEERSAKLL
jgi:hypothetical protein